MGTEVKQITLCKSDILGVLHSRKEHSGDLSDFHFPQS